MTQVDARLERDGNWWLAWITVDGEEQGTQGQDLMEVSEMATDLAAQWGVPSPAIRLVAGDVAAQEALAAHTGGVPEYVAG